MFYGFQEEFWTWKHAFLIIASTYNKKASLALKVESTSIYGPATYSLNYAILSLKVQHNLSINI
jgi:hypothetical protein